VLTRDPGRRFGDEVVLLDAATLAEVERVAVPGAARLGTLAARDGAFVVASGPRTSILTLRPRTGRAESAPIDTIADPGAVRRLLAPAEVAPVAGGLLATIDDRGRRLSLLSGATDDALAAEPAGVGPTQVVAGDEGRVYVTDTGGESILLFRTDPELALARRYGLPGAPYATTIDREKGKLWVTLTGRNEVVQLTGDAQPREQRRYATVRQPDAIAVDEATGRVFVTGRSSGELQAFDGYAQAP
jgi:streptogramin lyase